MIGRKLAKGYVDGKGEVEKYLHDSRVPTMTEIQLLCYFKKPFFTSSPRENYLLDLLVSNMSRDGSKMSHLGPRVLSDLACQQNTTIESLGSAPAGTPLRSTLPT